MTAQDQRIDWWLAVPPILVPCPLADALARDVEVVGRRVVVDVAPGAGGWLYEQRAVTAVHDVDGVQAIGVLPEADYWRTRRDETYVAVPHPVPLDRIWIEEPEPMGADDEPVPLGQDDIAEFARTRRLVPDRAVPPVRWPRRATTVTSTTGARCWLATPDGVLDGYRALSEPYKTEPGEVNRLRLREGIEGMDKPEVTTAVLVTTDQLWHHATDTGEPVDTRSVEPYLVWCQ